MLQNYIHLCPDRLITESLSGVCNEEHLHNRSNWNYFMVKRISYDGYPRYDSIQYYILSWILSLAYFDPDDDYHVTTGNFNGHPAKQTSTYTTFHICIRSNSAYRLFYNMSNSGFLCFIDQI